MFLRSEFRLALLALAASAPALAAPASRSGRPPAVAPAAVPLPAPFRSAADRVFANGLEMPAPAGDGPVAVYTDRAAFLAAVADGYAAHDFSEVPPGPGLALVYNDGTDYDFDDPYIDPPLTEPAPYGYLIFTGLFPSNPLYNGPGYLSTDRTGDPISVLTEVGDPPITALGADVWTSDFALQPAAGSLGITVIMQDGNVDPVNVTVADTSPGTFFGVIAPPGHPIAGFLVYADQAGSPAPGESPDRWPTLDNLVVGSARP